MECGVVDGRRALRSARLDPFLSLLDVPASFAPTCEGEAWLVAKSTHDQLRDQVRFFLRQEIQQFEKPKRLTNSTWTFSCTMAHPRRRFSFQATLHPIKGGVGQVDFVGPDDVVPLTWRNEDSHFKLSLTVDGHPMDLTAKVQRDTLALTDGTIHVQTHKRRLFSPSTTVKGRFTATPVST